MLLPALTVMSSLSGLVLWGNSTCPTPREVASRLPPAAAVKLHVEVRAEGAVELVLRDGAGQVIATQVLSSPAPCEALADEAAGVITRWLLAPPRAAREPAPVRKPLQVGVIEPRAPVERTRIELWVSGGFTAGNAPRGIRVNGIDAVAELQGAPARSGFLVGVSLGVAGPQRIASESGASGQGWRVAFAAGGGVRFRVGFVVIDGFVNLPLSLLFPTTVDPAPLSAGLQSAMQLGVQAGVRLGGWEGRFAPFVRIAVDATLVSSGQLMSLPVALNLGIGLAWSGA